MGALVTAVVVSLSNVSAANPATPGTAAAEDTVLVTELKAIAVSADEAAALTAELAQALSQLGRYHVMTVAEVNRVTDLQKNLEKLGCADESCLAELYKITNARLVLKGSIGLVGRDYTLTLSLMDVERQAAVGGATRTARSLTDIRQMLAAAVGEVIGGVPGAQANGTKARYHLPEGRTVSFAVLDLAPLGIAASAAENLTEVLAAEVKAIEGTTVISRSDIASMFAMEANRDAIGCTEVNCLAEIGGALGVDQLIVGDVGKVGEQFVVSLRVVDARNPQALSRVNESFAGLESQLVPAVKHAARVLLGVTAAAPGALEVEANEAEAAVSVDGKVVGLLPMAPVLEQRVGRHSVLVTKPGFVDWRSDIYVAAGDTAKVWVELQEKPVRWVFWGFVGVTGATAAGGAVAGILARSEDHRARELLAAGKPGMMDHLNKADSLALTSNVFWVSAGVSVLGTAVAAYLTNWD